MKRRPRENDTEADDGTYARGLALSLEPPIPNVLSLGGDACQPRTSLIIGAD